MLDLPTQTSIVFFPLSSLLSQFPKYWAMKV